MNAPTASNGLWPAPTVSQPIHAVVQLPGSKSLTNRFLVLAALAGSPSLIHQPLRARDTRLMVQALQSLGVSIQDDGDDWQVTPHPLSGPAVIDCGLAGNVMRFVPAFAGLANGAVEFVGDQRARERPLAPLLDSLRQLGVSIIDAGRGSIPFTIEGHGRVAGGTVELDSSSSSQFLSALLLAGCRFEGGLTVRTIGSGVPSQPHVAMTLSTLHAAGIEADRLDASTWRVRPGTPQLHECTIEPDLSNALPFFAAAMLSGGSCTIPNWPTETVQPLSRVSEILHAMGATVELSASGLTVTAGETLMGADLDMREVGELVPTITAIAVAASSATTIRGVAHLRGHETDRLAALSREFVGLGGDVQETEDGLTINPQPLTPGVFHSYADHRMATAGALVGLRVPGIQVENIATTDKTLPEFTRRWHDMIGDAAA
jgi:3-phosphoshikimate 1-carboxyvinyltransferase